MTSTDRKSGTTANGYAVCAGCGCVCDDIEVVLEDDRIAETRHACERGERWFREATAEEVPDALVDGEAVGLEQAVDVAARLLAEARAPLIYGLRDASCEAAERAVELADRLGATLDLAGSGRRTGWLSAVHHRGFASATLGELKNRADLIVLWHVDPEETHPRFFERFLEVPGLHVDGGRTIVEIHDGRPSVAGEGRHTIRVPIEDAVAALWRLRRLIGEEAAAAERGGDGEDGESPDGDLEALAGLLRGCRYGAWLYDPDGPTTGAGDPGIPHATVALIQALNQHVPFAALGLSGRGNLPGAESILTAQAGYPFGLDFAPGYPRFDPIDGVAARALERGAVDAALLIGCDPGEELPAAASKALSELPTVRLGSRQSAAARGSRVAIFASAYAVESAATVYRMDGMAIPARPVRASSRPSDAAALNRLAARIAELGGSSAGGAT